MNLKLLVLADFVDKRMYVGIGLDAYLFVRAWISQYFCFLLVFWYGLSLNKCWNFGFLEQSTANLSVIAHLHVLSDNRERTPICCSYDNLFSYPHIISVALACNFSKSLIFFLERDYVHTGAANSRPWWMNNL